MRYLFVLFVLVPLGELYLLLAIGRVIGFWPTVGLTLGTGIVGGYLAKREGLKVWREVQHALAHLEVPSSGLIEAALVLAGGIFLITPGVVSDIVGVLALVPVTRRLLARGLRAHFRKRFGIPGVGLSETSPFSPGTGDHAPPGSGPVIDTTGESRD